MFLWIWPTSQPSQHKFLSHTSSFTYTCGHPHTTARCAITINMQSQTRLSIIARTTSLYHTPGSLLMKSHNFILYIYTYLAPIFWCLMTTCQTQKFFFSERLSLTGSSSCCKRECQCACCSFYDSHIRSDLRNWRKLWAPKRETWDVLLKCSNWLKLRLLALQCAPQPFSHTDAVCGNYCH